MFTSVKSRLALVLSVAWIPVSFLRLDDYWTFGEWLWLIVIGAAALTAAVYAGFWVKDSPGFKPIPFPRVSPTAFPRWLGYALIIMMVVVIMGLPKVIF